MRITRKEKILLALLLSGCLATGAQAADSDIVTLDVIEGGNYSSRQTNFGGTIDGYLGCTFTNITSTFIGAALYNTGTIAEITGSAFTYNYSSNDTGGGGAIANGSGGTISSIVGTAFTGNQAADGGGAIYNDWGTISSITGSTFTNNEAYWYGGAICNFDTISTISSSTFTGNKVTEESGGAIENDWRIGSITGSTFTNNVAQTAGGAIFNYYYYDEDYPEESYGAYIGSIENSTFTGNSTTEDFGGAINNWSEIGSIINCTFDSNTAYGLEADQDNGGGGAIYNGLQAGVLAGTYGTIGSIEDSEFISNEAKWGGAIYNSNYAYIGSIKGSSFTGNIAKATGTPETVNDLGYGGAIFNYNIAYIDSIEGCTFTSNQSVDGDGGAIYNYDGATIGSITSSTFDENYAGEDGGAIYNFWETSSENGEGIIGNIENCIFTGNTSGNYGGAIFTRGYIGLDTDGETVTGGISNSYFYGNESNRGGAIYNGIQREAGSTSTGFDSIITYIEGCTFENNGAYAFGGAIYNYDDGEILRIENNRFLENWALNGNGGAIENAEAGSVIGTITHNYFYKNDVSVSDHGGGAIYSEGIINDITENFFRENISGNYGGAYYNNGGYGGTVDDEKIGISITGNIFQGNESGRGGAIYNTTNRDLTTGVEILDYDKPGIIDNITGNYFIGNIADNYGGAIYNYHYGFIGEIADNYFIENEADNGNGGAIENAEADAYIGAITNNYFYKNKISQNSDHGGGAIYNEGVIASFGGNTFEENTSVTYGGAIYNRGGTISTIGTATDEEGNTTYNYFIGNESGRGGAIYNTGFYEDDGSLRSEGTIESIESSYFYGNIADNFGGAIYNYHGGIIGDIVDNYFEANEALDGNGGAIENAELDAVIGNISGNTFYQNKVTESDHGGGAIYNQGIISSITENNFTENESGNFGGAIYNNGGTIGGTDDSSGTTGGAISGNYFEGNTSGRGGAISNTTTRSLDSEGHETLSYTTNYEAYGSIMNITGNTFVNNVAEYYGGAIYNYHGSDIGEISDNYFYGNEAQGGNGGAVENAEYDTSIGTMDNNTFVYNISAGNGGAIYNQGTIGIDRDNDDAVVGGITNSTFIGNEAVNGGAIYNNYGTSTVDVYLYDEENDPDHEHPIESTMTFEGTGKIGEITGNTFEGNKAVGTRDTLVTVDENGVDLDEGDYYYTYTGDAKGGAIYNAGEFTYTDANGDTVTDACIIGSITGSSFTNNAAISADGEAMGGAIYNAGTIGTIELTTLTGNYAEGVTGAYGGAIYNVGEDSLNITLTDDDVTGNVAYATDGDAKGGAIYSEGVLYINDEVETNLNLTGNYAVSIYGNAAGGAIYSEGVLNFNDDVEIGSNLTGNYAVSANGEAAGGAIYNTGTGEGGTLTLGDLTDNGAIGGTGASGGAIYDEISTQIDVLGTLTGNYATTDSGDAMGGAIYLNPTDTVSVNVWDDVTGNHATTDDGSAMGGAIYNNAQGTVTVYGNIGGTGTGESNYVIATENAFGGAIYNEGTLIIESSEEGSDPVIKGNVAIAGEGDALGGAIYNEGTLIVSVESIESNYATTTEGAALGGAIYSEGTLALTATSITDNHAISENGDAAGGAIYISAGSSDASPASVTPYSASDGTEVTITGDVIGNSAEGVNAYGGAIYNEGGTVTLYGNITGNYASATDEALGGAIYNAGTVNIIIEDQDAVINGNYANGEANVIYATADSQTNFTLTDATLRVDDSIEGETGYDVNVLGNGVDATTFYMYNDFLGSDLSIGGTTLNTVNNEVHPYSVNSFTVAGDFNMVVDVDLESETMDRIVTNGNNYGEAEGSLNVSGMNLISDTEKESVAIYFAEPGLMEDVTSSVGELPGSDQQKAYTPLYSYNVHYVYKDGEEIHYGSDDPYAAGESALLGNSDDGGYFVFNNRDYNPAVMATSEALMGAYGFMGLMFEYNFEHSDYYMKLPEDVRIAQQEAEEEARKEAQVAESDATKPAYYNRHELTETGAWMRAFNSNESVNYGSGWDSRDKYYGAMVGFDTKVHEHNNGWASVFTGYGGTMGIRQTYSGGHIKQHGMFLGATETFYKKNFYTAWTIAAGTAKAHEHTMYGHDKDRIDTYGIAGRIGYNLKLGDEGKFSLLPTFTASYTYVNPEDFTNAAGVKIDGSGLSAVQLNPNIKLLWNRDDGWTPYLTVGEVWTVAESSHVRANGKRLDELDLDPYTEYGIGIQKRWANERDAYVQVLGHSHGRDGILVNAGIRWNF